MNVKRFTRGCDDGHIVAFSIKGPARYPGPVWSGENEPRLVRLWGRRTQYSKCSPGWDSSGALPMCT